MKNEIEAKNVDKQGTSSHREQRLVVHLLKYGGCWIFALMVYATLMWAIPWKIGGTLWAVLISHGAVAFLGWVLYGAGAFDGDP
jgi:hypothetical protein